MEKDRKYYDDQLNHSNNGKFDELRIHTLILIDILNAIEKNK